MHPERRGGALALGLLPRSNVFADALLVAGFSLFIAMLARVAIPLPFTPVPITGQTMGVLLAGAVLGSRRGLLTLVLYLAEGAFGLPVYAGGRAGAFWGMATGGYLVGFVFAAFVVGWLVERGWDRGPRVVLAMAIGNAVIYLFGLPWLAAFLEPGLSLGPTAVRLGTLMAGLLPFVPGDLVKIGVASAALPAAWALVDRWRQWR